MLPPPDARDEAERTVRVPMLRADRAAFLRDHGLAMVLLVLGYVLLTALRDFRDNFAAEIWIALGYRDVASVFVASELPVAVAALAALGSLMLVRDNLRALLAMHGVILAGALTLGLSTLAFEAHFLELLPWMILTGAGLYLAYTPFNAMLFDRMIAAISRAGNAGFLIHRRRFGLCGQRGSAALSQSCRAGGGLAAILYKLHLCDVFRGRRASRCVLPAILCANRPVLKSATHVPRIEVQSSGLSRRIGGGEALVTCQGNAQAKLSPVRRRSTARSTRLTPQSARLAGQLAPVISDSVAAAIAGAVCRPYPPWPASQKSPPRIGREASDRNAVVRRKCVVPPSCD